MDDLLGPQAVEEPLTSSKCSSRLSRSTGCSSQPRLFASDQDPSADSAADGPGARRGSVGSDDVDAETRSQASLGASHRGAGAPDERMETVVSGMSEDNTLSEGDAAPASASGWSPPSPMNSLRGASPKRIPSDNGRRSPRRTSSDAGRSTPRRRHSNASLAAAEAVGAEQEVFADLLESVLRHSGSIAQQVVRARALEMPETVEQAMTSPTVPDKQMPAFEAKVDPDNILEQLPATALRPDQVMVQRISFMGTDWLGLRLANVSRPQNLRFCICAAAYQNIGKNTSRSVVAEICGQETMHGFACAPLSMPVLSPRRGSSASSGTGGAGSVSSAGTMTWLDMAPEIAELADIISNEAELPAKKAAQELRRWVRKAAKARRTGGWPSDGTGMMYSTDSMRSVGSASPAPARRWGLAEPGAMPEIWSPLQRALRGAFRRTSGRGASPMRSVKTAPGPDAAAEAPEAAPAAPQPASPRPALHRRRSAPELGIAVGDMPQRRSPRSLVSLDLAGSGFDPSRSPSKSQMKRRRSRGDVALAVYKMPSVPEAPHDEGDEEERVLRSPRSACSSVSLESEYSYDDKQRKPPPGLLLPGTPSRKMMGSESSEASSRPDLDV